MNFLETALALREKGYRVIPIKAGTKRALEEDWQTINASELDIRRWAQGKYKNGNIGILTEHTPSVDIDVYNADVAEQMERWIVNQYGETCVRVGQAPKRLLMFRTDRPFRKMYCTYNDGKRDHKVEILGHGQQFVAYGVHPDTSKPYDWTSFDEPVNAPADSLPSLTAEEADVILDRFEEVATARGWTRVKRSGAREVLDDEDAFERYKPILSLSEEKILDTIDYLPNENADYDVYLDVGVALHHQFKGEQRGLDLWHEWASKSDKYDAADLNRRWGSFGHGPDTKTFASLIYMANEERRREEEKSFDIAIRRVGNCGSKQMLYSEVIKAVAKAVSTDLQFDLACKAIQTRTHEITETRPRLETVRKALKAEMPKVEREGEVPEWCDGWVFVRRFSQFFNTETGEVLGRMAFDLAHGRHLVKDGEPTGGNASQVALDVFGMQQVYDYAYLPGEDRLVKIGRVVFVNRFNANSVPKEKQPSTPDEFQAIRVMEKHFEMLIPEAREREILLDWIAYTVQFPREKINWTPLLYSVDGAGKSWFAPFIACMIGSDNIRSIAGENLKEDKTSWAEGKKVVVIEEVRLHGQNRYDVLDKMKPYVANATVPVRRMHTDLYEIINVTNYLMFTNYEDALPINANDRRYFIIRCSLQTRAQIIRFRQENPTYFSDLFAILDWHADVLRHWFLTRRIADDFNAKGDAPETAAKDAMREAGEADGTSSDLEDLLNQGDPELCDALLNGTKLRQEFGLGLSTRNFGEMLRRAGFALIGKYQLHGRDGGKTSFYTRDFTPFAGSADGHLAVIRRMIEGDGFD